MTKHLFRLSTDFGTPDGDKTAHIIMRRAPDGTLYVVAAFAHHHGETCDLCEAARGGLGLVSS